MPKIKKYIYQGELLTIPEILSQNDSKQNYHTFYSRVNRAQMDIGEALSKPVREKSIPTDEWLRMGE